MLPAGIKDINRELRELGGCFDVYRLAAVIGRLCTPECQKTNKGRTR